MGKYLKLKFRGAGIFPKINDLDRFTKQFKSKDQSLVSGKNTRKYSQERDSISFYAEHITQHQISNMLHVLFGERPVPKNRCVLYNKIDKYQIMSENSYLRIDNYQFSGNLITETIQTKKALHNSWNPVVYVTWNLLKKYAGRELYDDFISILNSNNINTSLKVSDVVNEIRKLFINNYINFKEKLKLNKKTAFINYVFGDEKGEYLMQFTQSKGINLCVQTAVSKILKLSGEIIIPIDDDDLEKLRKSKGCATILDGGIVHIDKVINAINFSKDRILSDGFKEVKNISTETY